MAATRAQRPGTGRDGSAVPLPLRGGLAAGLAGPCAACSASSDALGIRAARRRVPQRCARLLGNKGSVSIRCLAASMTPPPEPRTGGPERAWCRCSVRRGSTPSSRVLRDISFNHSSTQRHLLIKANKTTEPLPRASDPAPPSCRPPSLRHWRCPRRSRYCWKQPQGGRRPIPTVIQTNEQNGNTKKRLLEVQGVESTWPD